MHPVTFLPAFDITPLAKSLPYSPPVFAHAKTNRSLFCLCSSLGLYLRKTILPAWRSNSLASIFVFFFGQVPFCRYKDEYLCTTLKPLHHNPSLTHHLPSTLISQAIDLLSLLPIYSSHFHPLSPNPFNMHASAIVAILAFTTGMIANGAPVIPSIHVPTDELRNVVEGALANPKL